eukprot:11906689-Alexandrium_andersonii.AAC.1
MHAHHATRAHSMRTRSMRAPAQHNMCAAMLHLRVGRALRAHVMYMLVHTCEHAVRGCIAHSCRGHAYAYERACASHAHANIDMQVRRRPGGHRDCGPQQGSEKSALSERWSTGWSTCLLYTSDAADDM